MNQTNYLAPFEPITAMMAKYREQNNSLVFDYRDPEGNKQARSHVHQLRHVKTEIADVHKAAKAEALEVCRKIDAYKNKLIGEVEGMITVHNEPLMQIAKEEAEKEAERLRLIKEATDKAEAERLAEIERREAEVKAREDAVKAAERKKEREEHARQEDAERAEREKRIAEEAKARAEAEHKAAMEAAERKRVADIEAERQRLIAAQQAKELAERRRQEQIEAERQKLAQDEEHRQLIDAKIRSRLFELTLNKNQVENVLRALQDDSIPNVRIEY